MSQANYLPEVLETTEAVRVASGFTFTEGPLWHPDGFFYFTDVRASKLYRITLGQPHTLVRETQGGNGTTFDLAGRVVICEGDDRRIGTEPSMGITMPGFVPKVIIGRSFAASR